VEKSSSGRLQKMGTEPKTLKKIENSEEEVSEEKALEAREIDVEKDEPEEITETAKLRLARTPTQVEIQFPDGMVCPTCKENLGLGEIICMTCEVNVQTGKKLKSKVKKGRNAYAAPKASTNDLPEDEDYGGLGRGKYWLYAFILGLVSQGLSMAITGFDSIGDPDAYNKLSTGKTMAVFGIIVITLIATIVLQVGRLRNLGMSGWRYLQQFAYFLPIFAFFAHWTLGIVVSIIAVFVAFRYLYWIHICPPGYEGHRTLDKNGKIILGILIFLFVLTMAGIGFFTYTTLNEVKAAPY
jgi:uncharacterized membrane protein YhaH (DUF805 family)